MDSSVKKLWIGNLDKRLSEYNLLKIIQQYGDVENFQYLFHTTGPNKGEPRTYCFVEYKTREDAERALQKLNGKVVHSKPLRVHWAEETVDSKEKDKSGDVSHKKSKVNAELSRDEKIKAIEGKLRLMEHSEEEKQTKLPLFSGKHRLLTQNNRKQRELLKKGKRRVKPYTKSKDG